MKKLFIVVSLHGCAMNYGYMSIDEIRKIAKDMIEVNKDQKIGEKYLSAIITDLGDAYVLAWKETEFKVLYNI